MTHTNHELEKGQPNGIASLNSNLKLQATQKIWLPPDYGHRNRHMQGFQESILITGVGNYHILLDSADSTILYSCPLKYEDLDYDGSTLLVSVYIELNSAGGGGDDLRFILDYAFVELGDDGLTKQSTINKTEDVSAVGASELTRIEIGTISGNAGAKVLGMSLTRNSTGGGSDTFSDDIKCFSLRLERV